MKKLMYLFIVMLLANACKKDEKAPAPATPPVTTSAYTSADSAISGDWILDVYETYNNGSLLTTTPHADPVNCHLDLEIIESTLSPGNTQSWKKCIHGLNCSNVTYEWRLNSGKLDINNQLYTIVAQTATNLEISYGSISAGGGIAQKWYLHK